MLKKIAILILLLIVPCWVTSQNKPQNAPTMKKEMPSGNKTAKGPTKRFKNMKRARLPRSRKFTALIKSKKRSTRNSRATYIYPPFAKAWKQKWEKGTGDVKIANAQTDGYVYHSSNSYDWGMSSSRCWVGFYYTAPKSGYYNIELQAYEEGKMRVCIDNYGEVYAYRNLGVCVEGLDWAGKTISDVYYDYRVGEKKRRFKGWESVNKTFYLNKGKTYWVSGYSEMGGWSNGDTGSWYTVNATCGLGPFQIEYMGN